MNTTSNHVAGRLSRRCAMSNAIVAALIGMSLAGAQPARGQDLQGAATPAAKAGAPMQMTISMTPVPAAAAAAGAAGAAAQPARGPNCKGDITAQSTVSVPVGKSTLVQLAEPTRNRTLGNPAVVMATLVSPRTLYLVGMSVGTTNMIVQGASGTCQVIDVIVGVDANGLEQSLRQLMPEERGIRVSTAAGNLVLGGHVSSASSAQQAAEIASAFANSQPTQQSQSASSNSGNGATSMSEQFSSSSKGASIINMMTVDSPQQVMLEVKVAEVSKTLIDQLGSSLNLQGGFGSWSGALVSSLLTGAQSLISGSKANNRPLSMAIDAQKTDELTKILAEPNLVTMSGQEASFLAGGKVFIPVPQSNGTGGSTITLQEEEFGVGLKFTPTVLAGGRINLKVSPEVSQLSPTGVTVSATGSNSTVILPLITTRRAATTVQMNDGESFAIGGLINNNVTGSLKALPGLGELPVIGALLRSTSFQQDRTELVFVITPHLVKPLPNPNYPLPTDSFTKANAADVYATGNMEGRGAAKAPPAAAGAGAPRSSAPAAEAVPAQAATGTAQANAAAPAPADSRSATSTLPPTTPQTSTPAAEPAPEQHAPAASAQTAVVPQKAPDEPAARQPTAPSDTVAQPGESAAQPAGAQPSDTEAQTAQAVHIDAAAARIAAKQKYSFTLASTSNRTVRR